MNNNVKPSLNVGNAMNNLAQRLQVKSAAEDKSDLLYELRAEAAQKLADKHKAVATNLVGVFNVFYKELITLGFASELAAKIACELIRSDYVGQQLTTV